MKPDFSSAYHAQTNGKHLAPLAGDTSDEDMNSRTNSLPLEEDSVDQAAFELMRKIGANTDL